MKVTKKILEDLGFQEYKHDYWHSEFGFIDKRHISKDFKKFLLLLIQRARNEGVEEGKAQVKEELKKILNIN